MRKRFVVIGLLFLFVAPMFLSTSCVRRSRMSGTWDGEWESNGLKDELTIEGDGPGKLIIECEDCGADDEIEAEIVAAHEFEIDDKNVDWKSRAYQGKVDLQGEGEIRRGEIELKVDIILPNGQTAEDSFEGDKD